MDTIKLTTGEELDPAAVRFMRALRTKESGGNYSAVGDAGTSTGAFQFQKETWQRYAKEVLGDANAAQDKANQNKVAYTKIKNWKDKGKSPEWIAAAWNAGEGKAESGEWRNNKGTTTINGQKIAYDTPKYVSDVISIARQYKQQEQPMQSQMTETQPIATMQDQTPQTQYTGRLGTKPGDTIVGKLLDNSITRGIQKIFPGKKVGEAIGTLGGYAASKNKDFYDLSAPTPLQVAGDVAQGALTVAVPTGGAGAGLGTRLGVQALSGAGYSLAGGLAEGETDNAALLREAAKGSAFGLVAGVAGEALGYGISRLSKPFASQATNEAAMTASRLGISEAELPLSSMSNSKTVRYMESLFGGEKLAAQAESASQKLVAIADELKAKTGIAEDLSTAGRSIAEGMKKFESTYKDETARLYDAFSEKGGSLPAKPFASIDTIHNIMDSKAAIGEAKDAQYFKDKLAVLTGGETKKGDFALPTFDTLKKVRTAVGEKIATRFQDPFVNQNIGQLKQLYGSLTEDMNQTVAATGNVKLMAALNKANDAYKQGKVLFDTEYARTIRRLTQNGQFDKIIPAIVSPSKSVSNIQNMLKVIGEENLPRLQSALLEDIFSRAKGTGDQFTELGMTKAIAKYGEERLRQLLTPEQFGVVKDLDTVARALGQAQKISKGSQTAFLEKAFAKVYFLSSSVKSLLTGNIVGAITGLTPILGEAATQKLIGSQFGRKLLTTGFSIPNLKETIAKTAGLAGMEAMR